MLVASAALTLHGRYQGAKKISLPACPSGKPELLHVKHTILEFILSVSQLVNLGNCSSNCSPKI